MTALLLMAALVIACPLAASANPYLDEVYIPVGGEDWSRIPSSALNGSTGQGMCVLSTSDGDLYARAYLVSDSDTTIVLYGSDGKELYRISDGRFGHANSLSWNSSAGVLYVIPSGVSRDPIAIIAIDVYKVKVEEKEDEEKKDEQAEQEEGEENSDEASEEEKKKKEPKMEWRMSIGDITYADESFEWPMNISYSSGRIYGLDTDGGGALTVYSADVGSDGFVNTSSLGISRVSDPAGVGLDEFMSTYTVGQGTTVDPSGRYIMDVRFTSFLASAFPRDENGLLQQAMCVVDLQTMTLVSTCGLDCSKEVEELSYTSGGSLLAGLNNWSGGVIISSYDTGIYGMRTPVFYRGWTVDVKTHNSNPELTDGNELYTLAGATYDLCTDKACTGLVWSVTTGADGYAGTIGVGNAGRYWLCERTASHGFASMTKPLVVDCSPWRDDDYIGIDIEKTPVYVQPVSLVSDHSDDLYGLVGSFIPLDQSYRHRYAPDLTGYIDEPSAKAAATFMAAGNGAVPFSVGEPVEGSWPYTVDGRNVVPLGTMTIEREPTLAELVSPLVDKTYVVHVLQDGNGGPAVARTSMLYL